MCTKVWLLGAGLLVSLPVAAMNWGFLRHTPVSHFCGVIDA